MIFSTVTLLCLALPAGSPVSSEEMRVAVAAVEEQLTSRSTLEVVYRTHQEWPAKYKGPRTGLLEDSLTTWLCKGAKQSFVYARLDNPQQPTAQWRYDGIATHEWVYDAKSARPRDVTVFQGPPRNDLCIQNGLAWNLGMVTYGRGASLAYYINNARQNNSLRASRVGDLLEIAMGTHDIHGGDAQVFLNVDPTHDYRFAGWRVEQVVKGSPDPYFMKFHVDEFQSVKDESTGGQVWFPLKAQIQVPVTSVPMPQVFFTVDSVRINHPISDDRFSHLEAPFGTLVREMPSAVGGNPRVTLVGGEAAHEQQVKKITEQAKAEIDRLEDEGTTYDGTPQASSMAVYWWVMGGILLGIACLRWMFRRQV